MQKTVAEQGISKVVKRGGKIADFDHDKITNAIFKAAVAVGGSDIKLARELARQVVSLLEEKFKEETPNVEDVQDMVEKVLIETGHARTAKAYILYRQHRAAIRREKQQVLEKEELDEVDRNFDVNALRVLKARYLKKDDKGKLVETPKQLFTRIAVHTTLPGIFYDAQIFIKEGKERDYEAFPINPREYAGRLKIGSYSLNEYHVKALKRMHDRFYRNGSISVEWDELTLMIEQGKFNSYESRIKQFYDVMVQRKFMPNTPAIANFGNVLGMGSACFVLGVNDSMESIMQSLTDASFIFKAGGGVGYNFSNLRHEGDYVKSTSGVASGPISFITLFDKMTEVIKQGGIRRGANMGILNSNHPDIEKFITAKEGNKQLRNFNISVLLMPDFWEHYEKNIPYPLISPRTKEVVRTVNPRLLFDRIVYQAWESAEPGVIFFDKVNEYNPFVKHLGPIVTTNPCVASDSLVSTELGLERIDSIKAENIVVDGRTIENGNSQLVTLQLGVQKVKLQRAIKTGYKDTLKLVTNSGYELIATPDHQIMTEEGWKQLSDLTFEDKILIQSGAGSFSSNYELSELLQIDELENYNSQTFLSLPRKWSRELGIILGLWCGDGCIASNGKRNKSERFMICVGKDEYDIVPNIKYIMNQWVDVSVTKPNNNTVSIRTANSGFIRLLKGLGSTTKLAYNKRVPKSIFTAPKEAVIGFLQGLFTADGSVRNNFEKHDFMIRLDSSSIELVKGVQLLLLNLGIKSSIYTSKRKMGAIRGITVKNVTYKHELRITKENRLKFKEEIGFLSNKKSEALKQQPDIDLSNNSNHSIEYFTDSVQSIEHAGVKEVWDITEPKSHSFIANGIIVHNCGEVLLYPNESCNLGSINVWQFAEHSDSGIKYNWDALKDAVVTATVFLDNVIDVNIYPLQAIEDMTLATRKIGLGVMGVGDLLYELGLPYSSDEGRKFMEKLMEFINYHSKLASVQLAVERGSLPYYDKSFYTEGKLPIKGAYSESLWGFDWQEVGEKIRKFGIRNGYTTVIAPTGSISMIAGCSSGMEPVYSLVFQKNVAVGSFFYANHVFEKVMSREGLYDEKLMADVNENRGGCHGISYIPAKLKKVFVTAMDITPEDHIKALAAFQKWTDSSISKTNNFPADATVDDMKESYLLAYKLGCKDVTVFRDSSIKDQVLVAPKKKDEASSEKCPECGTKIDIKEGCGACPGCGFSLCNTS